MTTYKRLVLAAACVLALCSCRAARPATVPLPTRSTTRADCRAWVHDRCGCGYGREPYGGILRGIRRQRRNRR